MRGCALSLLALWLLLVGEIHADGSLEQRVTVFFGFKAETRLENLLARDSGQPATFDWREVRDLVAATYGVAPKELALVSIATGFDLIRIPGTPASGSYSVRLCDDRGGERVVVLDAAVPAREGRVLLVPIRRGRDDYVLAVSTAVRSREDFETFQRDAMRLLRRQGAVSPGVPLTRDAFPCPEEAS